MIVNCYCVSLGSCVCFQYLWSVRYHSGYQSPNEFQLDYTTLYSLYVDINFHIFKNPHNSWCIVWITISCRFLESMMKIKKECANDKSSQKYIITSTTISTKIVLRNSSTMEVKLLMTDFTKIQPTFSDLE